MSNIGIYFYNSFLLVFTCFLNLHCAGSKTKTSQVDTHQIRLEPIAETMQNEILPKTEKVLIKDGRSQTSTPSLIENTSAAHDHSKKPPVLIKNK